MHHLKMFVDAISFVNVIWKDGPKLMMIGFFDRFLFLRFLLFPLM